MSAEPYSHNEHGQEMVEDVVARIRKRGQTSTLPHPSRAAIQTFLDRTANEQVMSKGELATWTEEWNKIEQEMKECDHTDDVAEGRAW